MTIEEAKKMLPIIQAFAEGKEIEFRSKVFDEEWKKVNEIPGLSYSSFDYRVKPEPEYRPFKDADECWQEMLKHEPFGWVRNKFNHNGVIATIICLDSRKEFRIHTNFNHGNTSEDMINSFIFADGAPFGVKEEA